MIYALDGTQIVNSYDVNGNLVTPYNKDGERIHSSHAVSLQYTRTTLLNLAGILTSGTQGIACDSITQSIAQLYSGNIYIIKVSDSSLTHVASAFNLGHAHTGQFAPSKTSEEEYPLLYVSGPNITVNEFVYTCLLQVACTSNSATMKKIYAVPANADYVGVCQVCVDFENGIVYHVAASTYYGTTDYMYITAWDMTTSELLNGASYSPSPQDGIYALTNMLFEFTIPFVPEMQACTFFDGLIVLLSDRSGVGNKYYQFVDVETQDIYMTMQTQIASSELEGVGFLYNEETGKYDMIVSDRSMSFYRYQFE